MSYPLEDATRLSSVKSLTYTDVLTLCESPRSAHVLMPSPLMSTYNTTIDVSRLSRDHRRKQLTTKLYTVILQSTDTQQLQEYSRSREVDYHLERNHFSKLRVDVVLNLAYFGWNTVS